MFTLLVASLLAAAPAPEGAPAPSEPTQSELEKQIAAELGASAPAQPAPTPNPAPGPSAAGGAAPAAGGTPGGNPFARLLLLPDISAIGSMALAWNSMDVGALSPRGEPYAPPHQLRPVFQELEVGLQAVVDPYARADVFLTFTPEGAGVEEAYLTTLDLPAGLQLRAGELYSPFGRLNLQHPHTWDFVDRPLALARLLAPDGLSGPGADVSWLAPVPWFAELHLAYQAVTPAFDVASHPAVLGRLVQFFDLGPATALGWGLSAARISALEPGAWRGLLGTDLFLKYRPEGSRSWLTVQAEVLGRRVEGGPVAGGPADRLEEGDAYGGYVQAVWRDGPFLAYGARYERAPALEGGPEHRTSLLLAWIRSEFERVRLQVAYDRLPGGQDGVEALLHLEFAIGAHGAHPF